MVLFEHKRNNYPCNICIKLIRVLHEQQKLNNKLLS